MAQSNNPGSERPIPRTTMKPPVSKPLKSRKSKPLTKIPSDEQYQSKPFEDASYLPQRQHYHSVQSTFGSKSRQERPASKKSTKPRKRTPATRSPALTSSPGYLPEKLSQRGRQSKDLDLRHNITENAGDPTLKSRKVSDPGRQLGQRRAKFPITPIRLNQSSSERSHEFPSQGPSLEMRRSLNGIKRTISQDKILHAERFNREHPFSPLTSNRVFDDESLGGFSSNLAPVEEYSGNLSSLNSDYSLAESGHDCLEGSPR